MDPNVVLLDMLRGIIDDDYDLADDSFLSLITWRDRGGFPPTNIRVNDDGSITISKETSNAIRS